MCLLVGMPDHNHALLFTEINLYPSEKKDVLPVSIGNFTLNTAKKFRKRWKQSEPLKYDFNDWFPKILPVVVNDVNSMFVILRFLVWSFETPSWPMHPGLGNWKKMCLDYPTYKFRKGYDVIKTKNGGTPEI